MRFDPFEPVPQEFGAQAWVKWPLVNDPKVLAQIENKLADSLRRRQCWGIVLSQPDGSDKAMRGAYEIHATGNGQVMRWRQWVGSVRRWWEWTRWNPRRNRYSEYS